jgi:hypothetical protein
MWSSSVQTMFLLTYRKYFFIGYNQLSYEKQAVLFSKLQILNACYFYIANVFFAKKIPLQPQ